MTSPPKRVNSRYGSRLLFVTLLLGLVVGAVACGGPPPPTIPRSPSVGPPPVPARPVDPRADYHTLTRLADGRVLVLGGATAASGDRRSLASAELYDPEANTWSPASPMSGPRTGHKAVLLADGRVLVFDAAVGSPELYDPATDTWAPAGQKLHDRRAGSATLMGNGQVLAAWLTGSFPKGTSADAFRVAERYDPATNRWLPVAERLLAARGAAAPLADGRVLLVGGALYDPTTDAWAAAAPPPELLRGSTAALLVSGEVLLAGRTSAQDLYDTSRISRRAYRYDPARDAWTRAADMRARRFNPHAVPLPNGQLLMWGGYSEYPSMELYDPETNTWSPTATMTFAHRNARSTLLRTGHVLFVGEGGVALYDPASDRWSEVTPW